MINMTSLHFLISGVGPQPGGKGQGTASDTAADNEISPAVRSLSDQSTHLSGSIETQIITRVTSVMRLSKAKLMTM